MFAYREENLISYVLLKKKNKDLQALSLQLCERLTIFEERFTIFEERFTIFEEKMEQFCKQATFRLDMQSAEQKEIRIIIGKLNKAIERFYEEDE